MQTTARVFDSLLLEGSKILHRVALAMLDECEPEIRRADSVVEMMQSLRRHSRGMHDRDLLMRRCFKSIGSLPRAQLDKLRAAQVDVARAEQRRRTALIEDLHAVQNPVNGKKR